MGIGLKRVPRLTLAIENILRRAESRSDLVTYSSNVRGIAYVADMNDVMIITRSGGYLRLPIEKVSEVMKEMEYVSEDAERRRRS